MSRAALLMTAVLLAACQASSIVPPRPDLASATYAGIYDQPVTLVRGVYQGNPFVAGGASRPVVTLLAQPRWQLDLDSDGSEQTLVLLTESSGGSGTFVYLALMSPTASGYRNVDTVLLGDRVRVIDVSVVGDLLAVQIEPGSATDPAGQEVQNPIVRWLQVTDDRLVELIEMAGRLTFGHEVREFAPCDDIQPPLWVVDATGGVLAETVTIQEMASYQPLFVTVLGWLGEAPEAGFAESFDTQITVVELLRAEREGPGCGLDLGGARYRALGDEPFWSVDVFADRLKLRTPSEPAKTFVRDLSSGSTDPEDLAFDAVDATGSKVRLQLHRQPCRDSMAGNRYVWQAELTLADRQLSGCALTPLPDP